MLKYLMTDSIKPMNRLLKNILLAIVTLFAVMNFAMAQVDANHADQAALDGIKGLGPTTSKAIIAERNTNGKFKDWADFESRVRGIGEKKSVRLSQSGLTVNGRSKPRITAMPAK